MAVFPKIILKTNIYELLQKNHK